jgi:hypothetical protein
MRSQRHSPAHLGLGRLSPAMSQQSAPVSGHQARPHRCGFRCGEKNNRAIREFLVARGYLPDEGIYMASEGGRHAYLHKDTGLNVDVFADELHFCHRIPFARSRQPNNMHDRSPARKSRRHRRRSVGRCARKSEREDAGTRKSPRSRNNTNSNREPVGELTLAESP